MFCVELDDYFLAKSKLVKDKDYITDKGDYHIVNDYSCKVYLVDKNTNIKTSMTVQDIIDKVFFEWEDVIIANVRLPNSSETHDEDNEFLILKNYCLPSLNFAIFTICNFSLSGNYYNLKNIRNNSYCIIFTSCMGGEFALYYNGHIVDDLNKISVFNAVPICLSEDCLSLFLVVVRYGRTYLRKYTEGVLVKSADLSYCDFFDYDESESYKDKNFLKAFYSLKDC